MRCLACDKALSDFEATRQYTEEGRRTGRYVDLCNTCLQPIRKEIHFTENFRLLENDDVDRDGDTEV